MDLCDKLQNVFVFLIWYYQLSLHPQTQCFVLKGLNSVAQNCCHQSVHFTELAQMSGERVNFFRPSAKIS